MAPTDGHCSCGTTDIPWDRAWSRYAHNDTWLTAWFSLGDDVTHGCSRPISPDRIAIIANARRITAALEKPKRRRR